MPSIVKGVLPFLALNFNIVDATWAIVAIDKRTGSVGCSVASCVSSKAENLQRVCAGAPGVGVVGSAALVYEAGRDLGVQLASEGDRTSNEILEEIRAFDFQQNQGYLAESRQFAVCQPPNEVSTESQCSVDTGAVVDTFCSTGSQAEAGAEWNCSTESQVFEQGDFIVVAMANNIVRSTVQLSIDGFFAQNAGTTLADRLMGGLIAGAGSDKGDIRCRSTVGTSSVNSALWVRYSPDDAQDCSNYTLTFENTGDDDAAEKLKTAYDDVKCREEAVTFCNQTCAGRDEGIHEISGVRVFCDGNGRALIQRTRVGGCTYGQISELSDDACGYLPKATVEVLARQSKGVHLEQVENGELSRVESVGDRAIFALRYGQSWHNADRTPFEWSQTAGVRQWCFVVAPCEEVNAVFQANSWPNMYHSCRRADCVHWLVETGHSATSSFPNELSSTWLVMNEPTESCRCVEDNVYDVDKDCRLDEAEVNAWLTFLAAGQDPAQATPTAAQIITALDEDSDGKLNRDEYSVPAAVRAFDPTVVQTFALMDTNRDGLVSPAEAAVVFGAGATAASVSQLWGTSTAVDMVAFAPLARPDNANTFDTADVDSTGLITASELQTLYGASPDQAQSILLSSPRGTTVSSTGTQGLTFAQFDVIPTSETIQRYIAADADRNGQVTATELQSWFDANELIGSGSAVVTEFDASGNNQLSVREFSTFLSETQLCTDKNVYDVDKDCRLDEAEVNAWLTFLAAGQDPAQATPTAAQIITALDEDSDGKLNRDEYSVPAAVRAFDPTVVQTFALMDTNRDGLVSPAEAAVVFGAGATAASVSQLWGTSTAVDMVAFAPLARPDNANTFDTADVDSTGLITASELQTLYGASPDQAQSILLSSPRGTTVSSTGTQGLTFAQFDVIPTSETIQRYIAADADRNGQVTPAEMQTYITENRLIGTGEQAVNDNDGDGDRALSVSEFSEWQPLPAYPTRLDSDDVFDILLKLNSNQEPAISQNAASALFSALDTDQDDFLSNPGEGDFLFTTSPTKVQGFAIADENQDGLVSQQEYAARFGVTAEEAAAEYAARGITGEANLLQFSEFEFIPKEGEFDGGDADRSGRLPVKELLASNACDRSITGDQVQGFAEFAANGNNVSSLSLAQYERYPSCLERDGFIGIDSDDSAGLNTNELLAFLTEKGLEPADADRGQAVEYALEKYDTNGDGELDFTEFNNSPLKDPGPFPVPSAQTAEPTPEPVVAVVGSSRALSSGAIAGIALGALALLLLLLLLCCLIWWCCCRKKAEDERQMYQTTKDQLVLETEPIAPTKLQRTAVDEAPIIESVSTTKTIEELVETSSNENSSSNVTQAKSLDASISALPSPPAKKLKKFSVTKLTNYKTEYRTEAAADSIAHSHARTFSQSAFSQSAMQQVALDAGAVDPYLSSQALRQNTHQVTDHDAWHSTQAQMPFSTFLLEEQERKERTHIFSDYIATHTAAGTAEFKERIAIVASAAKHRAVSLEDGYASQEETANAEYTTSVESARNKIGRNTNSGTPPVMQQIHTSDITHSQNVPMPQPVVSLPLEDIVIPVTSTTTTTYQAFNHTETRNEMVDVQQSNFMNADDRAEMNFGNGLQMHERAVISSFAPNPQPISIDDGLLKQMLPTDRGAASKKLRTAVYKQMDTRGRGFLSLDDTQRGMRDVIGLHEAIQSTHGENHIEKVVYGTAVPYAFEEAACIGNNKGNDKVDREEFRVLALYTRQYLQGYAIFDKAGIAENSHFNVREFNDAQSALEGLGLDMGPLAHDGTLFDELHRAGGNSSQNGEPTVTQQRFMQHVIRGNEQLLSTDLDELVIGNLHSRSETKKSVDSFSSDKMSTQAGFAPICLEDYAKKTGIPLQQILAANLPYGPHDPVVMERPVRLPPLKSLLNRPTTVNDYSRKSGIPIDQLMVANPHFSNASDVVDDQPVFMPWLEQTAMAQSF